MKALAKLQYAMKCERNKKAELICVMQQKAIELTEKMKILQNEIDALRIKCRTLDRYVLGYLLLHYAGNMCYRSH